jgi:hypothetical protein
MELKDVILSTLAEIEEIAIIPEPIEEPIIAINEEYLPYQDERVVEPTEEPLAVRDDEARMLEGIRERLLVLFEGFQSPNNVQIEAKVDLTLNFFEYLLATIDNRLETIKK